MKNLLKGVVGWLIPAVARPVAGPALGLITGLLVSLGVLSVAGETCVHLLAEDLGLKPSVSSSSKPQATSGQAPVSLER